MPEKVDYQTFLYGDGDGVFNEYEVNPGVCVLPIAEDPPDNDADLMNWSPVVVLRLHAPFRKRMVRYNLKKKNNPPFAPSPTDVGKFIYIGGTISFLTEGNMSACNYDWTVDTAYYYIENCVSRNQDGFVLGTMPLKLITDGENLDQVGGAVQISSPGAIGSAGQIAQFGSYWSTIAIPNAGDSSGWGYNTPSYYPGLFLNDNLVNANY